MRLKDKVAVVVGAGQTSGETIGNGRATAILFAREGARVFLVDRDLDSAEATAAMIREEGNDCVTCRGDVSDMDDCAAFVKTCVDRFGRIDVLHYNTGIGLNDSGPTSVPEEVWDEIMDVNLKGLFRTTRFALPVMRQQQSGVITAISSIAAVCSMGFVAYKTSKAGMNAFCHSIASGNAKFGIRVNVIMPGLMDTPMAIEGISAKRNVSREQVREERDAQVPLRGKMGTGWDIAQASLFLASDEAQFITGVVLPVDGGMSARIG